MNRITGLIKHCQICNKPLMGGSVVFNRANYHHRCYFNSLVQREYYNELSAWQDLQANLYYLDLL